jgi:hypothetical protein
MEQPRKLRHVQELAGRLAALSGFIGYSKKTDKFI